MREKGDYSANNILRKSAKPKGYRVEGERNRGTCERLVKLGLLIRDEKGVFRRTDLPDNRPGRATASTRGAFDFEAHRRRFEDRA